MYTDTMYGSIEFNDVSQTRVTTGGGKQTQQQWVIVNNEKMIDEGQYLLITTLTIIMFNIVSLIYSLIFYLSKSCLAIQLLFQRIPTLVSGDKLYLLIVVTCYIITDFYSTSFTIKSCVIQILISLCVIFSNI